MASLSIYFPPFLILNTLLAAFITRAAVFSANTELNTNINITAIHTAFNTMPSTHHPVTGLIYNIILAGRNINTSAPIATSTILYVIVTITRTIADTVSGSPSFFIK